MMVLKKKIMMVLIYLWNREEINYSWELVFLCGRGKQKAR